MDELRAAESIRYLASQYASMVFVAEQLEKIGSLEAQIKSLTLRHTEADQALREIVSRIQAEQKTAEEARHEYERLAKERMERFAEQAQALDEELLERRVRQEEDIHARAVEAAADAQSARDAHQTHMAELNEHLVAMGERIAQATAEAVAAEARRDRAQETVGKLQATIAAIKIEGVIE